MKLSDHVRISTHAEGAVILDVDAGRVYSANGVGARILYLLSEKLGTEDIARQISADFTVPMAEVRQDVERFLTSLRSQQLIET